MGQVSITVSYNGNGTTHHKLALTDSENHVGTSNPGDPAGSPNRDNITTDVAAGDTITWTRGTGIADITGIAAKAGSNNFLQNIIHNPEDHTISATIAAGFTAGDMEAYNILYKIPGNDTIYVDDPKMKMKAV